MAAGRPSRSSLDTADWMGALSGKTIRYPCGPASACTVLTATTMLATVALAGAAFSQSRRLVNRAGLFQQVSLVTGFGQGR